MKTNVKFLIEKPGGNLPCEVFAFFPNEKYSHEKGMFTSYAHVGQHSACHIDYANECREAKPSEYQDLLKELQQQGYDNLFVLNKMKDSATKKSFTIITLSKADLLGLETHDDSGNSYPMFSAEKIMKLTNEDMQRLASKLSNDYCEQLYWQSLELLADYNFDLKP